MRKIIMLVSVIMVLSVNIGYSLDDVKLKLPKGSTGEVYRAKSGHNYYTVVKVNGREQVMFANIHSLEVWSRTAGVISTREELEKIVKGGGVKRLGEKSEGKVPDEVKVKADGTVEVISWK